MLLRMVLVGRLGLRVVGGGVDGCGKVGALLVVMGEGGLCECIAKEEWQCLTRRDAAGNDRKRRQHDNNTVFVYHTSIQVYTES